MYWSRPGGVLLLLAIAFCFCIGTVRAQDPPELALGFDGPLHITGAAGSTRTADYVCTLTNRNVGRSVQLNAFTIGLTAEPGRITSISFEDTDALLIHGAAFSGVTDLPSTPTPGAVARGVLPASIPVPAESTIWLARVRVEVVMPETATTLTLRYADGLESAHPAFAGRVFQQLLTSTAVVVPSPGEAVIGLNVGQFFRRADVNGSGRIDIADPIFSLEYLFQGGRAPTCFDAADGNDDGRVDLGDSIFVLNYLFLAGPKPPAPLQGCGVDSTPDLLDCKRVEACNPESSNFATLTWTAPTTNEDGTPLRDLGGFMIYYGPVSREHMDYPNVIDVRNVTEYTIESLPARGFHFAVTAYDLSPDRNESVFSTEVFKPASPF